MDKFYLCLRNNRGLEEYRDSKTLVRLTSSSYRINTNSFSVDSVFYEDVRSGLNILNINPRKFKEMVSFKTVGAYPDLERESSVDLQEFINSLDLGDGIFTVKMTVGDLVNNYDGEKITLKDMEVVFYDYTQNKAICKAKLIKPIKVRVKNLFIKEML